MNCIAINNGLKWMEQFTILEISEDVDFWMIRSKGGYFYQEYVREGFIALGWNYIDQSTSINSQTLELLKEGITNRYGDKRPMYAINKCRRFIEQLKEGDYVIIPDMGSTKIAVCKVGEYYEEEIDYKKEIEVIRKVENKEFEIDEIKCPYKKRRKIEVLLEVPTNKIGYNILKALTSYHGLSSMNDYANDILNCVYDCYSYKGDVAFALNVGKRAPLRPRELAKLLYGITEVFCSTADEEILSTSLNLNSPGKVMVLLKKGFSSLKKKVLPFVGLYLVVIGGSGFGFEFPGIVGFIKEAQTVNIDREKAKAELDSLYLENYQKALDLIKAAEEEGVDLKETIQGLETLEGLSEILQFKSNQEFASEQNKMVEIDEE